MIRFTKRFYFGMPLSLAGILIAFNYISNYRTYAVVLFWTGILTGVVGCYLMFKGIKPKKIKIEP